MVPMSSVVFNGCYMIAGGRGGADGLWSFVDQNTQINLKRKNKDEMQ